MGEISEVFADVYYGDLCGVIGKEILAGDNNFYTNNNIFVTIDSSTDSNSNYDKFMSQCTSLIDNKLHAGLTTYFSYLINFNSSSPTLLTELITAHTTTTAPAMLIILSTWRDYFINSIDSFKQFSNIIIYLYLIITVISFLSLWMIYLNKLNSKLNMTIQMLNMIPIRMLPKGRKDAQ